MKNNATVYRGIRQGWNDTTGEALVLVNGVPLSLEPSLKIRNHSPDGFNWGYGGSGPAQLALAILLDFTGKKSTSERLYQKFKSEFVARWAIGGWMITGAEIKDWIENHE